MLEEALDKVIKDKKTFSQGVTNLFTSAESWSIHFNNVFSPIAGEYDILGKYPDSAPTSENVSGFQTTMQELKVAVLPELELIESRITGPCKELQGIIKAIRKNITKRDHKLLDYDRFNNSLTKLREKKEKSLSDEKNLFKLEQDFEQASADYDLYNTSMKTDLPRFMILAAQFIDPLFHSLFYMQLNIFYLVLEKIQEFSNGKYEMAPTINDIVDGYESRRTDAKEQIEGLQINKRLISTAKLVQTRRQESGLPTTLGSSSLGRNPSVATTSTLSTSPTSISHNNNHHTPPSLMKKPPPPPPGSTTKPTMTKSFGGATPAPNPLTAGGGAAPPPPYTPPASGDEFGGSGGGGGGGTKRAPPPLPFNKPKPPKVPTPQPVYVLALYDFEAQAEGDLSFSAGDHIEIVKRSDNPQDWWTGRLNGAEGVFPGNYVEDV